MFQVLVVAQGYEPTFFSKTDPLKGPLEAKLKERSVEGIPPKNILLGRVVNAKKEPMPYAVVSVQMTQQGNTGYGFPPEGTDPIAITDEEGNFAIYSREVFDHMTLKVEARTMAPLRFNEVKPGPTRRELVMTEGAALRGRVLLNGKPVKDVAIGAVSVDRSDNFSGDYEYATNEEGIFYFPNLPPDRPYYVYGRIHSTMKHGAIPAKQIDIKGDGTVADAGDLEIVPGFRLAGEVRLADGTSLPRPTRLTVGRREAWDSITVELTPEGKFSLTNIPTESISVGTRVNGYRPSRKNKSLDRLNPFGLHGMLTNDKTNLVVLLERGDQLESEWLQVEESQRTENLPISGIEDGGAVEPTIQGTLLDANTGKPIATEARVIPGFGRSPRNDFIEWQTSRAVTATSGLYELDLPMNARNVTLQVLAEEYEPHVSKAISVSGTNVAHDITLNPGKSPAAILLDVNGKPASGVKVYCIGAMEQGSLNNHGEVNIYRSAKDLHAKTDAAGRFKILPKPGAAEIVAATAEGFIRLPVKNLPETITLQRYGTVKGRLVSSGKAVPEEMVDLHWQQQFNPQQPHINLHGVSTDENGAFEIRNVPPGRLKISRREKFASGGWTNRDIEAFEMPPGETLDLGEVEYPAGQKRGQF